MIPFLKPDIIYEKDDVTVITVQDLKSLNVNALILDLDNTIMAPKAAKLDPHIEEWLIEMKKHFKLIVLSNNRKKHYIDKVQKVLDFPILGSAEKPWPVGIKKAMEILNESHEKIAVIGDRPLTDIWLAHMYGFKSVLVRALTAHTEPRWKFYLRKVEWSFIRR
jgi:HAD superfamily phosphatase (TIGR01668 family)